MLAVTRSIQNEASAPERIYRATDRRVPDPFDSRYLTAMPRFVATTQNITIAVATYLRIVPQEAINRPRYPHRSDDDRVDEFTAEPPPDMPTGSDLEMNGKPVKVVWADRSRALIEVADRAWLMSHMTPWEMSHHPLAYERGSLVQEWIVREEVDLSRMGTA